MEPDWANMEALALSLVLDKLKERIDHVWFGAVCKNWQLTAKLNHQNHQFRTNALPMLVIAIDRNESSIRRLYGIPAARVYPYQLRLSQGTRCCGSSHGWLATVDDASDVITLLNPFKRVAPIVLPPGLCCVRKVSLSADPITSPNDYVVAAIFSGHAFLAFMRAGETFWTCINTDYSGFTDTLFYKGILYAVSRRTILSFSLCRSDHPSDTENRTPHIVLQENYGETCYFQDYLVKSLQGDLWMVRRFSASPGSQSKRFHVYNLELDVQCGMVQQVSKLDSLDDNVVFLGDNDSTSVSASYFPTCLQKDSIYFANDLGIYNVKDGSIGRLCSYSFEEWMPSPFWILPPFQWD